MITKTCKNDAEYFNAVYLNRQRLYRSLNNSSVIQQEDAEGGQTRCAATDAQKLGTMWQESNCPLLLVFESTTAVIEALAAGIFFVRNGSPATSSGVVFNGSPTNGTGCSYQWEAFHPRN